MDIFDQVAAPVAPTRDIFDEVAAPNIEMGGAPNGRDFLTTDPSRSLFQQRDMITDTGLATVSTPGTASNLNFGNRFNSPIDPQAEFHKGLLPLASGAKWYTDKVRGVLPDWYLDYAEGVAGGMEGFTSPASLAFLGGLSTGLGPVSALAGAPAGAISPTVRAAAGALQRGLSTYFAADMGKGAAEQLADTSKPVMQRVGEAVPSALMALGAGYHAVGKTPVADLRSDVQTVFRGEPVDTAGRQPQTAAPTGADTTTQPTPTTTAVTPVLQNASQASTQSSNRGATPLPAVEPPKPVESVAPEPTLEGVGGVKGIPGSQIATRPDLMQFKRMTDDRTGASETHKETIAGDWDPIKGGNLLLWEPKNPAEYGLAEGQKYIVADGHGRFLYGTSKGVEKYNAQILKESDGYTANDAMVSAALKNIADGKGTIYDQAKFLRNTATALGEDATIARAKKDGITGKRPAEIAFSAADSLWDSFINERVTPEQAAALASAAPRNEAVQRMVLSQIVSDSKMSPSDVRQMVASFEASGVTGESAKQVDLFGKNESAMIEMRQMAKAATAIIDELKAKARIGKAVTTRAVAAGEVGVKASDQTAVLAQSARSEVDNWERFNPNTGRVEAVWQLDPAKVRQVRERAGLPVKAEAVPVLANPAGETPSGQKVLLDEGDGGFKLVGEKKSAAQLEAERVAEEKRIADERERVIRENTTDMFGGGALAKPTTRGQSQVRIPVEAIQSAVAENPHEIIADFSRDTGSRTWAGKPSRGAAGTYYPGTSANVIRLRGDLDTAAHELAHYLDDAYGIVGSWAGKGKRSPFDAELLRPPFEYSQAKGYNLARNRAEAVAEWVRAWVVNPVRAEAEAPQFAQHFKQTVPPEALAKVAEFSDRVRKFAGAPAGERLLANTRLTEERPGLVERVKTWVAGKEAWFSLNGRERLVTDLVNDKYPVIKAMDQALKARGVTDPLPENDPRLLLRNLSGSDTVLEDVLVNGVVDGNGKRLTPGGVEWELEPFAGKTRAEQRQLERDAVQLLISQRVTEKAGIIDQRAADAVAALDPADPKTPKRAARLLGAAENVKGRLSGQGGGLYSDAKEAATALTELQRDPVRYAAAQDVAARYRQVADGLLQYWVSIGRLDVDTYNRIKAGNEYYASMRRVQDELAGAGWSKSVLSHSELRKFQGSTRRMENPLVSLQMSKRLMYEEGRRNQVLQAFADLFDTGRKMYQGAAPAELGQIGRWARPGEPNTVKVYVDGQLRHLQVDPEVYNAWQKIGVTTSPEWLQWVRSTSAVLRSGVVYTPRFQLRNIIRDTLSRSIVSDVGSNPAGIARRMTPDMMQRFQQSGGDVGFMGQRDVNAYYRQLDLTMRELARDGKTVMYGTREAFKFVKEIAHKGERLNRDAEFLKAYEHAQKALGYDEKNAALYAGDKARQLLDFDTMGRAVRFINQYVPFTGAKIRGLSVLGRAFRERPVQTTAKALAYTLAPTMVMRVWNSAQGGDDQYHQLTAFRRMAFWNFYLGQGRWLTIPKAHEAGLMGSILESAYDKARGQKNALEGTGSVLLNTGLPLDDSSMAGPFRGELGAAVNYDMVRGAPIVPRHEEKLDLSFRQGVNRASRLGIGLGRVTNTDPRYMDHLVSSHFGGMGLMAQTVSDIGRTDRRQGAMRYLGAATGLFAETPALQAPDTQWVLKYADKYAKTNEDWYKGLRNGMQRAFAAKTDKEYSAAVDQLNAYASQVRRRLEAIPPPQPRLSRVK